MFEILDAAGVTLMVTGQSNRKSHCIEARFDDRVILTSTNMSDDTWSGSKPAALEIFAGVFTVVGMNSREVLLPSGQ